MKIRIKRLLFSALFFLGWLLSPLTFWNDLFINIPFAYICASLYCGIFGRSDFLMSVLVFYWLSNVLGIALMYVGGRLLSKAEVLPGKALLKTLLTIVMYSVILAALICLGALKPLPIQVK